MLDRPQEMRVLDLAHVAGVVPGRLHRVRRDNGAAQRQRFQQRLEVRDLVRLPGLGDLVLADDQPGDVGDRPQQVHLLLPAGLGELAFLAVHRHRHPGRDVTGVAGDRRVQPRVAGCRPEPAAGPGLAQRVRGMWPAPPRRHVLPGRGTRGGRPGLRGRVQRRARHQPGQRRLQLIGIQVIAEPVQRRRRRRHPPPGHRADPAAVPGQHLLAPARGGLRNRQRAAVPAGNPATSTDTSDASPCRTPCGLRWSLSRAATASGSIS